MLAWQPDMNTHAREGMVVKLFDRFGSATGRSAQGRPEKVIDGQHPERSAASARATEPDMLPVQDDATGARPAQAGSIIVAVTGSELDREIVSTACTLAKMKHFEAYAIFGIEVPRTLPIDAEMEAETSRANDALDKAVAIAECLGVAIEPEIVQSRHFGQSLLEESAEHNAALIILGAPYHLKRDGQFDLGDTVEYMLKHAPCKLWVVRGKPPVQSEREQRAVRANSTPVRA